MEDTKSCAVKTEGSSPVSSRDRCQVFLQSHYYLAISVIRQRGGMGGGDGKIQTNDHQQVVKTY